MRKEQVNGAAEAGQNRSNTEMSELTLNEQENLFHSPRLWGKKINLERNLGKFNSVFIAAGVCTCSKYYQHASRTSNNTIFGIDDQDETDHCQYYSSVRYLPPAALKNVMKQRQGGIAEAIGMAKP